MGARDVADDVCGAALLGAGVPEETIKAWSVDPQVVLPGGDKKGSLFDSVEDMDVTDCLAKLLAPGNTARTTPVAKGQLCTLP